MTDPIKGGPAGYQPRLPAIPSNVKPAAPRISVAGNDNVGPSRFTSPTGVQPGGGGETSASDPNAAIAQWAKQNGFSPVPGRPGVFVGPNGTVVDLNGKAGNAPGGGGADNTVGLAQVGLGYAQLAQANAHFAANFEEGKRQFQANFDRNVFVSDRAFKQAEEQFATQFAEGKRQFQLNYDRSVFTSDRAFKQAEDQFTKSFIEGKRQFDTRLGADQDMFDLRLMSEEGRDAQRLASEESRFAAQMGFEAETERARLGMTAEQMASEQSRFDRQASLAEKENRQQILRGPSDFVNRGFEARGETAPTARITHADLINEVAREANAARAEGAASVANARRMAASVKTPVFNPTPRMAPTPAIRSLPGSAPAPAPAAAPQGGMSAEAQAAYTAAFAPGGAFGYTAADAPAVPRMEHGGQTQANAVVTGDSSDGKENEELVIDLPNDGGLMVIPKKNLIGKRKRMAEAAPKAEFGGMFNTPGTMVSQNEIVDTAKRFAPPAVRDLASGARIAPFKPAISGLTPRRLSMLNAGEREATNTYLGVVENTTLEDEMGGLAGVYGPQVSRARARMVSF